MRTRGVERNWPSNPQVEPGGLMAKRVFFSFHYLDVAEFRANVVRNHWLMKPDREAAGYFDASVWESARRVGVAAVKRLIDEALEGTSNTCVLIGSQTFQRQWVRYELFKSVARGNHLFGVHINGIRSKDRQIKPNGSNPFDYLGIAFSPDGAFATRYAWDGGKWVPYLAVDDAATYDCRVGDPYRGNFFRLSAWYPVFDWAAGDGYNRFSTWVR